jgi:hypothetical protein
VSDTPVRAGSRLGPYILGRWLPESDPTQGHVYEAHHVDTGAAALVLVPDAAHPWTPRVAWSVRSLSEVSPPFLAVEMEQTPEATTRALHELTLLYIRLSGALASVEEREDTAAFLARDAHARPRSSRSALPMGLAAVGGVALVLMLLLKLWGLPGGREAETQVVADERVNWADLTAATRNPISYPLPSTPLKGQHKPPCYEGSEVEINGGCWVTLEKRAPCPKGYAEHEGKCYMPSREPAPEPRSVEP